MTPYRFSFETDEQYQERTQSQQTEKPSTPTKEQGTTPAPASTQQGTTTATVFQQMSTPPGQHSSTILMMPWWLSTTLAVTVFAVFYVAAKRRSARHPKAATSRRGQPIGFHLHEEQETEEPLVQDDELQSVALPSLPGWKVTRIGSRGTS